MKTTLFIIAILVLAGILAVSFLNNRIANMSSSNNISPAELKKIMQNEPGVVIDVRTDQEYNSGHLTLSKYQYDFSGGEFARKIETLDKDKTYYLFCRTGNRSGQAARLMKKNGFENVYNVGGFKGLVEEGFETK